MAKKIFKGIVVKTFGKTISVEVENLVKHPIYLKSVKRSKKILSHDEESVAKVGDVVRIEECSPISKRKSFNLKSVVNK